MKNNLYENIYNYFLYINYKMIFMNGLIRDYFDTKIIHMYRSDI